MKVRKMKFLFAVLVFLSSLLIFGTVSTAAPSEETTTTISEITSINDGATVTVGAVPVSTVNNERVQVPVTEPTTQTLPETGLDMRVLGIGIVFVGLGLLFVRSSRRLSDVK